MPLILPQMQISFWVMETSTHEGDDHPLLNLLRWKDLSGGFASMDSVARRETTQDEKNRSDQKESSRIAIERETLRLSSEVRKGREFEVAWGDSRAWPWLPLPPGPYRLWTIDFSLFNTLNFIKFCAGGWLHVASALQLAVARWHGLHAVNSSGHGLADHPTTHGYGCYFMAFLFRSW